MLAKSDIIAQLKKDILLWEGVKPMAVAGKELTGLKVIAQAFPNHTFPAGVIHEFMAPDEETAAAADGFVAGLLSVLTTSNSVYAWISNTKAIYPTALRTFIGQPERVIFIHTRKKDLLWVAEECLKCKGIAAVIAEVDRIDLNESRRLQLAVERSQSVGFILRTGKLTATSCNARWQVSPLPSLLEGIPGVGYPRWQVDLLKVRNGRPGSWQVEWRSGGFAVAAAHAQIIQTKISNQIRKVG